MSAHLRADCVVAEPADHVHRISQARDRDGLVGALSAGVNLKIAADHGLAGQRNFRGDDHEILVDAPHHNNRLSCGQCVAP